jgi:hypothetical protein
MCTCREGRTERWARGQGRVWFSPWKRMRRGGAEEAERRADLEGVEADPGALEARGGCKVGGVSWREGGERMRACVCVCVCGSVLAYFDSVPEVSSQKSVEGVLVILSATHTSTRAGGGGWGVRKQRRMCV